MEDLGGWQASGPLWTRGQHGEFLWHAALAVGWGPQGVPQGPLQGLDEGRADQGHIPICGDVVAGEVSAREGHNI